MTAKRRGLGRGLGALIPGGVPVRPDRPVDVTFFPGPSPERYTGENDGEPNQDRRVPGEDMPGDDGPVNGRSSRPTADDTQAGETAGAESGAGGIDVSRETILVPVPGARFAEIPLDSIVPNPRQPRQVFDDDDLAELAQSVREIGVLQPVVVRPLASTGASHPGAPEQERYELIMGERRWRATQLAGLSHVPAIVRDTADDELLRDALLENLHRSQLNSLEEAAAYSQLLEDFGCTHDELARRIGRSRPQISNTIRLLRLPPLVQRRVAAGVLSAGHARALLGLADRDAIEKLAGRIVAEGLSVRAVEEVVALGGDGVPVARARRPRAGARNPQMDRVAARLADRLDTRVSIALGRRKGRITVEFATVDDLNRILAVLDVEVADQDTDQDAEGVRAKD